MTIGLPAYVVVDPRALHVAAPSLAIPTARLSELPGTLRMPAGTRLWLLAPEVTIIVMMGLALWAISQLRALFRALGEGRADIRAGERVTGQASRRRGQRLHLSTASAPSVPIIVEPALHEPACLRMKADTTSI